jgi:NAD(P)-dependent dehydrogenase (short-subunit alcohol dehydrogenase family)
MARWMVGKGAKNIVLVSRTGTASGKVKQLIDEVATSGVNILVQQCDVSNAESVKKLIEVDLASMPPVKGVIHGAMVLHVRLRTTLMTLKILKN